jgi:hypothetical protein
MAPSGPTGARLGVAEGGGGPCWIYRPFPVGSDKANNRRMPQKSSMNSGTSQLQRLRFRMSI